MIRRDRGETIVGTLKIIGKSPTVMYEDSVEDSEQICWTNDNAPQVELAEKTFKEYTNRGWLAISDDCGKKKQIFSFDPELKVIILVPLAVGG